MTKPVVFISYSHTNDEHKDWVRIFAERLRKDGVDVLIDIWELQLGNNINAFCEKISLESTDYVLAICDQAYQQKANAREHGVGMEAQIISSAVYRDVHQSKVIPVLRERLPDGMPCTPTFLESRMMVDFSTDDQLKVDREYKKLLRHLHNIPEHRKPDLGDLPTELAIEKIGFLDAADISSWSQDAIIDLCNAGIMSSEAGNFYPQKNVSRAEFAKITVLAAELIIDTTGGPHFNDAMPSDWFYYFAETLYNNGVIGGIDGGQLDEQGLATFAPDQLVTREEIVVILVDAFDMSGAYIPGAPNFTDIPLSRWSFDYIESAYAYGILGSFSDGTFKPDQNITKEQLAVVVHSIIQGPNKRKGFSFGVASSAIE